ncbi:MAG: DEAD/DEAH box helicase [Candidatus Pacebacteria bacterium]|nr:DEAD/DEAH box helicase [Candidatus Paceibacterota bacterium]
MSGKALLNTLKMTLAETLKEEILTDDYFINLFQKAERISVFNLFNLEQRDTISDKEYKDLMQFADILSHSTDPNARNKAYKVIALLVEPFGRTESFRLFSGAILAKLGNFPALQFLRDNHDYVDCLPLEREIEKRVKSEIQKTSNGKYIFTDAQYKIRKELEAFDYFSFSGPTSIGKSFIMKDYIRYLLNKDESVGGCLVIVVPTRALITQVVAELRKEIDDETVNIASHPVVSAFSLQRYKEHIFVFTPERLLSYVSGDNLSIKYLFIDEAQKVIAENDSRSSLYYHAIYETTRKYATKIIFASPNIPNPDIFLKLFEKDPAGCLAVTDQTVAQNRYFVDLNDKKLFLFSEFGQKEEVLGYPSSSNSNDLIKELGKNVNNIIYCNGPSETVRRAKDFALGLENVPSTHELRELLVFISEYVHKDYYLIECLKKGVAFHHGKMPQKVRRKVEEFFANKDSTLRYIFCTSTLLEGVNLPAKNIFVMNDNHGSHDFEKIDFENLIGRAGRLTKDFSGNVICVKDDIRRWEDGAEVLKKIPLEAVDSFLINKQKAKKKEFLNIGKALVNNDLASNLKVGLAENLVHYASIVLLHHMNSESSVLKTGFLEKNKSAIEILQKTQSSNRVPSEIIKASSTIKPVYQNKALVYIEKHKENAVLNVSTENNELIVHALERLYDLYNWEVEEARGRDPLIPSALVKAGYGKSKLNYWAMLLRNWTKSEPLSRLIGFSITYYTDKGEIWFQEEGIPKKEKFIGNQKQINIIIEEMMKDIENGLRFKIEKYFLNYYLLSKHVLGVENAGQDWSEFIEYGTTDKRVIELQNIGFSRGTSKHLLDKYGKFFSFNHESQLTAVNEEELLTSFDQKDEHYEEVKEIFRKKVKHE